MGREIYVGKTIETKVKPNQMVVAERRRRDSAVEEGEGEVGGSGRGKVGKSGGRKTKVEGDGGKRGSGGG